MTAFLLLTRQIGNHVQNIAINLRHVIAAYPATDFDTHGNPTFPGGTDIWTTMEAGHENASPWRVLESNEDVSAQVTWLLGQRGAA